jgi:hypothetical protein
MTAMAVSIDRIAAPAARVDGLPRPRVAFGLAWPRRSLAGVPLPLAKAARLMDTPGRTGLLHLPGWCRPR